MDCNTFNIFHVLFTMQRTVCPTTPLIRPTPIVPVYAAFLANAWKKRHNLYVEGEGKLQRIKAKCDEYRSQRDDCVELVRSLDQETDKLLKQMNRYEEEREITINCQETLRHAIKEAKTKCVKLHEQIDEETKALNETREKSQTLKKEMRTVIRDTAEIQAEVDNKMVTLDELMSYSKDLNTEIFQKIHMFRNECDQRQKVTGEAMVLIMNRLKEFSDKVNNLKRMHKKVNDLAATARNLDLQMRQQTEHRRQVLANNDFPWIWILIDTFFPRPRLITEQEDQQETQRMEELLNIPTDDLIDNNVAGSDSLITAAQIEEMMTSLKEFSVDDLSKDVANTTEPSE